MLKLAAQLKEDEFGAGNIEVAKISDYLADIYTEEKNFTEAIKQLSKASKISANYCDYSEQKIRSKEIRLKTEYDLIKDKVDNMKV